MNTFSCFLDKFFAADQIYLRCGFDSAQLFVCCAFAPIVGFSFAVCDREDDNLLTVYFIYKGIRKFSDDKAPALVIEPGPAARVLSDQSDATFDFSLEVKSNAASVRIVPAKRFCVIF